MTASRAGVFSLTVFMVMVAPAAVSADDAADIVAGVRLATPTCLSTSFSIPAFVESLRVELASRASNSGPILVTLGIEPCDPGTTRVQIAVVHGASGRTLVRDVGLEDVTPEARPRALALAVAELVRGAQPPSTVASPPAVATDGRAVDTTGARGPAPAVGAEAVLSLFPSRATALWGGRLSLSADRRHWQFGAFADTSAGERTYDVGRVAVQSFGAGLAAGPRWVSGRVTVNPGIVVALAWTRIQGHAAEPGVDSGAGAALTVAVRARVAASVSVGRGLSARGFVEGGLMARGFDATVDGVRAAGLSGASVVVGLGVGFGAPPGAP
jgi:hypothetical protein